MSIFSRRKVAPPPEPSWQDSMPGRAEPSPNQPFFEIPEIDRWRAISQDMPSSPDRGAVLQRVRQLVEGLVDGVDEGNGAALDRLIETWVAEWIATVDTAYIDACTTVSVHHGVAAQLVVTTEKRLETAAEQLERAKRTRDNAYHRLAGTDQED